MARAQLDVVVRDTDGDVVTSTTVSVLQDAEPGTAATAVIADTMKDAASGGGTLTNPLTTDANGRLLAYFDTPGTHVPGYVRLYRSTTPTVDQRVRVDVDPDHVVMARPNGGGVQVGPVRADVRGYLGSITTPSTTDCASAFNSALTDNDMVYVPAGVWRVDSAISVAVGKTLWSDVGIDAETQTTNPTKGAILKAGAAIATGVISLASRTMLDSITVDGNDLAVHGIYAVSVAGVRIINCMTTQSTSHGINCQGMDRSRILGGHYLAVGQDSATGVPVWHDAGADCIFMGFETVGGQFAALEGGAHNIWIGCHFTGRGQAPESTNALRLNAGANQNQFISCYYDSADPDNSLVYLDGSAGDVKENRFIGMKLRQNNTGGAAHSIITVDGSGCDRNYFAFTQPDLSGGSDWTALINVINSATNTHIGPGDAKNCTAIWDTSNIRPVVLGPVNFQAGRFYPTGRHVFALTDAATVSVNPNNGDFLTLSTAASRGLGNPTACVPGHEFILQITNTDTSNITPTYGANYRVAGAIGPVIGPSKTVHIAFVTTDGTNWIEMWRSTGDA